jgi:hypothetical protein
LVDQCLKIASYGVFINAALIVGFDSDDPKDIFARQFDFVQKACVPFVRLNLLKAYPGTDLRRRLLREGRVLNKEATFTGEALYVNNYLYSYSSNILFPHMKRSEIYTGLLWFVERVWDWKNLEARICGFIDNVKRLPEHKPNPQAARIVAALREALACIPGTNAEMTERVFAHAEKVAPPLMLQIAGQLLLTCWEMAEQLPMRAAIRKQIEIERTLEKNNGYVLVNEDPDPPLTLVATAATSSAS